MTWPSHGQDCIVLEATIPDPLRYCYMTEADMTTGQSTTGGRESRRNVRSGLANDFDVGVSLQGAPKDLWKMWTRRVQQTDLKIARDTYTGTTPIPHVDRSTLVQEVDISSNSKSISISCRVFSV